MTMADDRREVPHIVSSSILSEPDKRAAELESAGFEREELEKEARRLQHHRREGVRNLVHQGAQALIMVAIAILVIMVATWGWHLLLPENLHYLSPTQYHELKNVLFSAALSAFVADYARKIL